MSNLKVGVLGLQGAYAKHADTLLKAGASPVIVRYREQLDKLDGLIIPGGESTTMSKLMGFRIDYGDILNFGKLKPVFGTCAGLILLGLETGDPGVRQLGLMDVQVSRNAYGSQKDSFVEDITLEFDAGEPFHAVFIRAPRIISTGNDVRVLSTCGVTPVLVESGLHVGASFHPELTPDVRIHAYFINKIMEVKYGKTKKSA